MMFKPGLSAATKDHEKIYGYYEMAYTIVDFSAALLFIIGSWMFFYPDWTRTGTWLFLVGSIFFGIRPSLRLAREIHLASLPLPKSFKDALS